MKEASGFVMLDIPANIMGRSDLIHPTLIWDQETVILVDAAFPGQSAQIRQAIEAEGVPFEKLNLVILTHHDIDHIGGLAGLIKESPIPIKVLAHQEEKAYIQGDKPPLKLAQLEANLDAQPEAMKSIYEKLKAGFESSRVGVDQTLTDGERLPYCGGITVIHTPGHTLGHICLYLEKDKTLIAGDALAVRDGVLTNSPLSTNYDMSLYKRSLEKLAQYDIEQVICYHGGMYKDHPNQRIAALVGEV